MGMETIEVVMAVEETFAIEISDQQAGGIRTVGDLYAVIVAAQGGAAATGGRCLTAATFYKLRQALVDSLTIHEEAIRPQVEVDRILPRTRRRAFWANLQRQLDLRLPSLVRPRWLTALATLLTIAVAFAVSNVVAAAGGERTMANWAGFLSLVPAGWLAWLVTAPLATAPSSAFATFRGLAHVVLTYNFGKLSEEYRSNNPVDVWTTLQTIVAEQLGMPAEQVTMDARFYEDLYAG